MRSIKEKIVISLLVIIPLMMGALLYYLLCPDVYFVKIIDYYANINIHIDCEVSTNIVTRFFRNFFFDYIWAFAFVNALCLVSNQYTKALLVNWTISVLMGGGMEIFQYVGIVYGTFDILDIVSEVLGATSAAFIIKFLGGKKDEKI